jgi:hypothetical protein
VLQLFDGALEFRDLGFELCDPLNEFALLRRCSYLGGAGEANADLVAAAPLHMGAPSLLPLRNVEVKDVGKWSRFPRR